MISRQLRISRRIIILLALCLLLVGIAAVFIFRRPPAIFLRENLTISSHDVDTIDVTGTRIPGGEGIWRYHISGDRWELVPSKVVNIAHLDKEHNTVPRERFALEQGSVILCQATDEPDGPKGENIDHETKHFIQVQLKDGSQTELGVIPHSPAVTDWALLPDHSGIWVVEQPPSLPWWTKQMVIHLYSFKTHRWTIAYRSPGKFDNSCLDNRRPSVTMLSRHGDWLLIFHNVHLSSDKYADLWINLTTGAGRLGASPLDQDLARFSPNGQYCVMVGDIVRVPDWPLGAGVIGDTYSRAVRLGTLSEMSAEPIIIGVTQWSADSHHLYYADGNAYAVPVDGKFYDGITRWLEHHTHLQLRHRNNHLHYHLRDLTGKELGVILSEDLRDSSASEGMNDQYLLACVAEGKARDYPSGVNSYYLTTWCGTSKREIFRTIAK